MQRRWGEWAVIGFLAFYFSLPFWGFNFHLAGSANYLLRTPNPLFHAAGYWPHFTLGLWALVEIWAFVFLARKALYLLRGKRRTVRFQLQLRTLWVLTVAASVLLALNLQGRWVSPEVLTYGFPEKLYKGGSDAIGLTHILRSHLNLFVVLSLLGALAMVCEFFLWPRSNPQPTSGEPAALEQPGELETLTTREKWCGTIPLFLLFALIWLCGIAMACVPFHWVYYPNYTGLSQGTQAFLALCEKYYFTVIVLAIFAAWGHLQFASRDRRRARRVNRWVWIALYLLLFSTAVTLSEIYFKVPERRRQK
jgi:hypothetical protein